MSREHSTKPTTFYQLKGYAGLAIMSEHIKKFIPCSKTYCEPFAGLARTCELKHDKIILNDLSEYSNKYCREKFPNAIVENMDFEATIKKYDSEDTFFLIDPPWRKNIYKNNVLPVCDRTPIQYYDKLLNEILPTLKGNWILCVDKDEHEIGKRVSKSKYNNIVLEHPTKVLFGRKVGVRMCMNKVFLEIGETK